MKRYQVRLIDRTGKRMRFDSEHAILEVAQLVAMVCLAQLKDYVAAEIRELAARE